LAGAVEITPGLNNETIAAAFAKAASKAGGTPAPKPKPKPKPNKDPQATLGDDDEDDLISSLAYSTRGLRLASVSSSPRLSATTVTGVGNASAERLARETRRGGNSETSRKPRVL